jgi:hypothetical protein
MVVFNELERTIGLDGVVDQQDNYRNSGFELAYRNIRQAGLSKQNGMDGSSAPFLLNHQ